VKPNSAPTATRSAAGGLAPEDLRLIPLVASQGSPAVRQQPRRDEVRQRLGAGPTAGGAVALSPYSRSPTAEGGLPGLSLTIVMPYLPGGNRGGRPRETARPPAFGTAPEPEPPPVPAAAPVDWGLCGATKERCRAPRPYGDLVAPHATRGDGGDAPAHIHAPRGCRLTRIYARLDDRAGAVGWSVTSRGIDTSH
jgi:hypothetical protein